MKKNKQKNKAKKKLVIAWLKKNDIKLALTIWYGFSWSWVLFTDTLDLAGNKKQGFILAVIILSINVALSVFVMLKMVKLVQLILKKHSTAVAIIIALPLFAFADFLTAWVPAFFWIGPEGRLDSILPLSSGSLLAINSPFVYASRLVGFFGLGGFVWLIIFLLWNRSLRKYIVIPSIALAGLSIIGWIVWHIPKGTQFTAVTISESLNERVSSINADKAQLVVFPEYGLDNITNNNLGQRLTADQNSKSFFLGSLQIFPQNKVGHLNRLIYGNTQEGITFKQDKYRLIPGGEDLPYLLRLGLRATNQKSTLDYFSYAKGTLKGPSQLEMLKLPNDTIVGAAVCSSIISPEDYRYFAKSGATIFTNSASLTIFKGSPLFSWQQKSFAKFMAVSNSRYFLQSANSARSYVLDNNGNTLAEANGQKVLTVQVQNNTKKTLYTHLGEYLVLIGFCIVLWQLIKKVIKWKNG